MISPNKPSQEAIYAAAEELDNLGRFHNWWPDTIPNYIDLDPIGKNELETIAFMILKAAYEAESSN